jgi:hypothetical protein
VEVIAHHFRRHGAVHATWVISILIAVIAALLLILPNGNSVGNYIAFAASIASLVLAVVAIAQSLVSNQGLSETLGSLRTAAHTLSDASLNVETASAALDSKIELVVGQVARVPEAVEALSAKFDARQALTSAAESDISEVEEQQGQSATRQKVSGLKLGTQVSVYAIAKSLKENVAFNPAKLELDEKLKPWRSILAGAIIVLHDLKPFGMEIESFKVDNFGYFKATSLGELDLDEYLAFVSEKKSNHAILSVVDDYFSDANKAPITPEVKKDADVAIGSTGAE